MAVRGDPLLVSRARSSIPLLAEKGSLPTRWATSRLPKHVPDLTALEGDHRGDSHKLSVTIEVVDEHEKFLGSGRFSTDRAGYAAMRTCARAWPTTSFPTVGSRGGPALVCPHRWAVRWGHLLMGHRGDQRQSST